MPYISTKKKHYDSERENYQRASLRAGTYICVLQPWPDKFVGHRHPFKLQTMTQSWPLRFEHCTTDGTLGATITLWVECEPNGEIKASELGEGRFAMLREALRLPETEEFDTNALSWAYVKVVVKEKQKGTDRQGNPAYSAWPETLLRCSPEEQELAAEYVLRMHPEAQ